MFFLYLVPPRSNVDRYMYILSVQRKHSPPTNSPGNHSHMGFHGNSPLILDYVTLQNITNIWFESQ